jgi:uncharacterized membrane protein YeiB
MGRMALTNYLMQSMLVIIIFYNLGFGLGGDIGPAIYFSIGLVVYAFQVLYSTWWFKYFLLWSVGMDMANADIWQAIKDPENQK